jgi:L-lysine exporter family protein LysE/ArgO
MIEAFLNGLLISIGMLLPLGMQSLYLFNQGANHKKFTHALPSIFTAIICDTFLIVSSVLGLSLIVFAFPWVKALILYLGLVFLIYIGFIIWFTKPYKVQHKVLPLSPKKQILFAASVSLFNPHALIDTIGVIGTISMKFRGLDKWIFTSACILVSASWAFCLSFAGHVLHKIDNNGDLLLKLNKISAILIWGFAFYLLKIILKF